MAPGRLLKHLVKAMAVAAGLCSLPYLVPLPKTEDRDPREFAPETEFLPVEGLLTHYRTWGQGKPILLIHGFWSWSSTWEPMAKVLARSGYKSFAVDLKGFGLSEKPPKADYSHRALARFALSFMEALGLERVPVIASSMGGNIALHLALRYPERVSALVLIAPAVFIPWTLAGTLGSFIRFPPLKRTLQHILRRYTYSSASSRALSSAYSDPSHLTPEVIERYKLPFKTPGWDSATLRLLAQSGENSLVSRLSEISQPTLAIWGKEDRVVPPYLAQRLALNVPNCRIQFIGHAGHLPHEEQPEAAAKAIEDFLRSEGYDPL